MVQPVFVHFLFSLVSDVMETAADWFKKKKKASDVNHHHHELTLSHTADVEPGAAAALLPAEGPQIAVKSRDMMKLDVLPTSLSTQEPF